MDTKDSHTSQHVRRSPRVPRITKILGLTRWFSVVTVFSSLIGALLMFVIGAANTVEAVLRYLSINDFYATPLKHFMTPDAPGAAPRPAACHDRSSDLHHCPQALLNKKPEQVSSTVSALNHIDVIPGVA